uniref:Glycine N-acyltransferase-like protein n=1 Tax=Salarias fasciatus TaxID=181472 RepID=A0A672JJ11_SALFA
MKVLNREELRVAEEALLQHLPKSYKVYAILFGMNKNKPATLEVVVDTWSDFKVIICRPDPKVSQHIIYFSSAHYTSVSFIDLQVNKMCFSLTNKDMKYVQSTEFATGGLQLSSRKSNDSPLLLYNEFESRISSLKTSYVLLVNQTWKFGGNQQSYIRHLINSQPVSWILVYDYGALGVLYTLPEHRGKGYAKVLISTMAKKLLAESHPVYCYIEEDNSLSYKLFKNLGFIEDPSYRPVWLEFIF